MLKEQKGITLVALVVTIIVLIILAGVSISMVIGNNGIAKRAQEARDLQANAAVHENQEIANLEKFTEQQTH